MPAQVTAYGLVVAVPSGTGVCEVPGTIEVAKNCTLVTDAVASLAAAVTGVLLPGVRTWPAGGPVSCTVGTWAAPLQAKPFTVKKLGTAFVALTVPVNPIVVEPPVPSA